MYKNQFIFSVLDLVIMRKILKHHPVRTPLGSFSISARACSLLAFPAHFRACHALKNYSC